MAKCGASYSQRRLRLAVYIIAKDVLPALLCYNKMEPFSFKSRCVVRVKHLKEDCFTVLW